MTQGSRRASSTIARALAGAVLACGVLLAPVAGQGSPDAGTPPPTGSAGSLPPPMLGTGDSRSDGEGPGFVGSPVAIAAGVLLLGGITAAGTLIVLRATGGRRR